MSYRKTAITVPESVLADVDRAARIRGESRSKYITTVLRAAVRARRDAEITHRLNELFAAEDLARAQREEAAGLDEVGTDWTNERW
jgi:metal-responsive CopG/Arc/MetJ family transcriptional regulator